MNTNTSTALIIAGLSSVEISASTEALATRDDLLTRRDVEFEVTDVQALYEACPMLVTLEPKKAMIKIALKDLREGQSLPGVKHWIVSKAH